MPVRQIASLIKTMIGLMSLVAALSQGVALAQELPKEPILRIETGMHTAPIKRIGVDAANRFLVTASDDKTVRVWELPEGRLLRIIRVPIGAGSEGKLSAVAISPDGSTIAAGGHTGHERETTSIYLFDRESGRLVRRLGGLPNAVAHLVYSPDGHYLAATLLGKHGVRVFSTTAYAPAGEDKAYGDSSYGADFDRAGNLVTSSFDGSIRLYATGKDGSLHLLTKTKAIGGLQPFDVKFSPDGTRVAVGFYDSAKVAVLQALDLASLYAPDTTVVNGKLGSVAWSADGNTLYAGGVLPDANGTNSIRTWADGGRGGYRDIAGVATGSVPHILPLRNGGIAYGSTEPAFGIIDASGRRQTLTTVAIADYRALGQSFLLAPDGTGIGFAYQPRGQDPARFSLTDRRLDPVPTGGLNWRPPETEDNNLRVTDWGSTYTPKLNGIPLKLVQYELSRNLALALDRSAFVLGTTFNLRLFDRNGTERWRVAAPAETSAVNVSADGRLAVAAFGDGTIRWYRMTDGKELLAFFPHADRKRWVLWTPTGYYDASPGAEDLIGWHVNNGKEQAADFFPVGRFRAVYYRPDVIAKVLLTQDETIALRAANEESGRKQQQAELSQRLPPVVEITSPTDGAETTATGITVRFRVRTPSGEPVTGIKALVDGRPVNGGRGLKHSGQAGDLQEMTVTVPEQDSEISLLAENRYAVSVPATVRVRWRGAAASKDEFTIKPKLYMLAVGISKYANKDLTLGFAAKDAGDFVATMERQKGGLYRDVVVKLLTDEKATKDEVLDGLDWIRKETTSKDVAMVFMAGHGVNDQNGFYFFCPYNIDPEKILRTGVPFTDIKNTVSSLAGKTLFFVDTCHSGNVMGTRRALVDVTAIVNELTSAENGAVVFAASTGNQYSLENVEWGNGAFTKALVEALSGRADYGGKGKITINMVDLYLSERVKELTKGKQTPTTTKPQTIQDFPIAVKQ